MNDERNDERRTTRSEVQPGSRTNVLLMTMRVEKVNLKETIAEHVHEAILQVCGGGIQHPEEEQIRGISNSSISFPNNNSSSDLGGKPHDIEVRAAISLFHLWKRQTANFSIEVVSQLGLTREIATPRRLAELWVPLLEQACGEKGIAYDIRTQPSGMICIVTYERSQRLRQAGRLPCPHCCHWCKGKKGLWWHQHQKHTIEYAEAVTVASSSINDLAIVPYDRINVGMLRVLDEETAPQRNGNRPFKQCNTIPIELVKNGNLVGLKEAVNKGYMPSSEIDRRGASPLHWAAGSGHLDITRYLVEECACDPVQGQRGKRSFSGRTALHWAARNGHLDIVQYLVRNLGVDLEAATIDGTTAFCWASWQGHLKIMDFLHTRGSNIHTVNSFGCNAALWCAQGKAEVEVLEWLATKECSIVLVNNNGHGVVHKAAQRGWKRGCKWVIENRFKLQPLYQSLKLVGPDTEGYCPSDLAGMEGYEDFARWLVMVETGLVEKLRILDALVDPSLLPNWLTGPAPYLNSRATGSEKENYTWERYGGLRRMRANLAEQFQI